jgi:hypothetical protein
MSSYQALVNLSHPRRGDPGKETDLIYAGETVDLTDEEAAMYLPPRRDPPLIRPGKESGQPLPRMHPRALSGVAINPRTGKRIGSPGPPQGARPDPEGSSAVQVLIPEAAEPQPDDETLPPDTDAVDIPPRGAARRR